MTCGDLSEGLELHFLESGVRIRPIEGQLRFQSGNMRRGQFEITQEAALLLNDRRRTAEPVLVKIDGQTVARQYLPVGGLSIEHDLMNDTVGNLKLEDPLRVFSRSVMSESFFGSFPVAIEEIMNNRDDPSNVITGTRFADDDLNVDLQERAAARVPNTSRPSGSKLVEKVEAVDAVVVEDSEGLQGQFNFNDIDGFEALQQALNMFGLDGWVDATGVLILGVDPSWGEVVGIVDQDDVDSLVNYTVTRNQDPVSNVLVRGTMATAPGNEWLGDFGDSKITAYAYATDTTTNGRRKVIGTDIAVSEIGVLEGYAERELLRATIRGNRGSIEWDGLKSTKRDVLARLDIGSYVEVDGDLVGECATSPNHVDGGTYNINSLTHRWNPREGWRVIADVGEVPLQEDIETNGFFYNPSTGRKWKDTPVYESQGAPDESPLRASPR